MFVIWWRKGVPSCKRDTKSSSNPGMELAVQVFWCKLPQNFGIAASSNRLTLLFLFWFAKWAATLLIVDGTAALTLKEKVTPKKRIFFGQRKRKSLTKFSYSPKCQPLKCRFSLWNSSPKKPKIRHHCRQYSAARLRFRDVIPSKRSINLVPRLSPLPPLSRRESLGTRLEIHGFRQAF